MKFLLVLGVGCMLIPAGLEAVAWIARAYRKRKATGGEAR